MDTAGVGMEGNLEDIIKPSHKPAGCPPPEQPSPAVMPCPMGYGGAEGQKDFGEQQWSAPGRPGGRTME